MGATKSPVASLKAIELTVRQECRARWCNRDAVVSAFYGAAVLFWMMVPLSLESSSNASQGEFILMQDAYVCSVAACTIPAKDVKASATHHQGANGAPASSSLTASTSQLLPFKAVLTATATEFRYAQYYHSASVLLARHQRFSSFLSQCRYVAAPMVGISDLPFRLLCREYGATVCYTEMIDTTATSIPQLPPASCTADRPLVVQFAANDGERLLTAALAVQSMCDAVCLNLGCPQRTARRAMYGAYLLDDVEDDRRRLLNIVHHVTSSPLLHVPLLVKIRVLDSVEATISLCRQLVLAGASLIAIHARQRGRVDQRRDGAADLSIVRHCTAALQHLPVTVLTNGNVRTHDDLAVNLHYTRAHGIMCAEALAHNPALFSPTPHPPPLTLALRYLQLVEQAEAQRCVSVSREDVWLRVVAQVWRMAGERLAWLQVVDGLERVCSVADVRAVVELAIARQAGGWQRDEQLQLELDRSNERRQQTMERLRTRMRQQEEAGDKQPLGEMALLNSRQRKRLRKREEKATRISKKHSVVVAHANSADVR